MKVLVYPYDKNPYQKLLYGAMRKRFGSKIFIRYAWFLPFVGALHIPFEIALRRLYGYKIIHIHWIAFFLRQQIPNHYVISWYLTRFNLWWMKQLGYKTVWTVHDITPHQKETRNDLDIAKRLSNIVDVKIIHSTFTKEQLDVKGLNSDNCVVVQHGNYDGVYADNITRQAARKKLGIMQNKRVILFFGIIKTYKGVDSLLAAYSKVATSNTVLVIAGRCSDEALNLLLEENAQRPDVIVHNNYIDNADVATYFKACDLVCLPFKAITTSGSTLLALTFGKPIVAPRQGSLNDIPTDVGYLYDPANKNALQLALESAIEDNDLESKAKASRRYADTLAWEKIAEKTYNVYKGL